MIQIDIFELIIGLFSGLSQEQISVAKIVYDVIVQGIGLLSLICSLISFQMKKRSAIMVLQMAANLLFSLQLVLLGAITGALLDLISFVRTLIFSFRDKYKWASVPVWPIMFVVTMIATGILTYDRWYSFLAIMGSVLSTIALWMRDGKKIRLISLAVGPCWFVYNLIAGSYTGAINEVIAVTSIIIGIVRHDIKRKPKTGGSEKVCEEAFPSHTDAQDEEEPTQGNTEQVNN